MLQLMFKGLDRLYKQWIADQLAIGFSVERPRPDHRQDQTADCIVRTIRRELN